MPRGFASATGAAYVAAYVALDWVSYLHPVLPFAITPWNPPPGLSIALLTLGGLRFWPAVVVAVLLAELLVRGPGGVLVSAVLAVGYIAVAAVLVRRLRFDPGLASVRDVVLLVVAALAGTAAVALVYVGLLVATGALVAEAAVSPAVRLWVGDALGIIVTAPLAMVLVRDGGRDRLQGRRWVAEPVLQALTIAAALVVIFVLGAGEEERYFYLLFLPLVWISLRHGLRGAVLGLVAIQLGLVVGYQLTQHPPASVLELQILMLAIAITGLLLGGAVSDRRAAISALAGRERVLERTMRAAAAAELASSLAHELNQPLAAASNYVRASRLMVAAPTTSPAMLTETMDKAVAEIRRAGDVVRRLREFFRSGGTALAPVDLRALADDAAAAWHERARRIGAGVQIDVPRDLPAVLADATQIGIVLHNLVTNALDAVEGEETSSVVVRAAADAGGTIRVSVADSGPGISDAVIAGLFQPFVTTKSDGLGLGLAISRSIVEQHGGRLWAEHAGARGATFCFTLPAGGR